MVEMPKLQGAFFGHGERPPLRAALT